jgi:hypothetical protein
MANIVSPWRYERALGPDVSRHWLCRVKGGLDRFGLAAASGKFRSFTKTAFCRGFTLRMLRCLSDFLAPINRQFHACGVFCRLADVGRRIRPGSAFPIASSRSRKQLLSVSGGSE